MSEIKTKEKLVGQLSAVTLNATANVPEWLQPLIKENGVYVGTEPPTDPEKLVWINPNGEGDTNYYNKNETDSLIDTAIQNIDLSSYATKVELENYDTSEQVDAKINAIKIPEIDLSGYAKKSEIPDVSGFALKTDIPTTNGLATEQYVNNAIANIEIPEGIQHITITDVSELLNLADGLYIVDGEFTVETISQQGQSFGGLMSVKQDWFNYTFIDYNAYIWYNNGDATWDCDWYATESNVSSIYMQLQDLQNAGYQTEEQVITTLGNTLSGLGYQNSSQVQQIVTQMDIDASQVKHIQGDSVDGYILVGGEYTLQQMANAFDAKFKAIENAGYQTQEQVNALINTALGVIENGTY